MASIDRKRRLLVFQLILLSSTFTTAEGQTRPKLRTLEDGVARSLGGGRGLLGRRPSPGGGPHGTLVGVRGLGFLQRACGGRGSFARAGAAPGPRVGRQRLTHARPAPQVIIGDSIMAGRDGLWGPPDLSRHLEELSGKKLENRALIGASLHE